jgi:hypothetical protein
MFFSCGSNLSSGDENIHNKEEAPLIFLYRPKEANVTKNSFGLDFKLNKSSTLEIKLNDLKLSYHNSYTYFSSEFSGFKSKTKIQVIVSAFHEKEVVSDTLTVTML